MSEASDQIQEWIKGAYPDARDRAFTRADMEAAFRSGIEAAQRARQPRMKGQLHPIQLKILHALVAAGGQISDIELKALYEQKGDGMRNCALVNRGYTDWVRDRPHGRAHGLMITERGRSVILNQQTVEKEG